MTPNQPYREAGTVDTTDIDIARIKESEETKRHAVEQRMKDREDQRIRRYEAWKQSDGLGVLAVLGGLAIVLTPCALAIMYCAHLWFPK